MTRAAEVYAREFDLIFFKLPLGIREAIESKIEQLGSRLGDSRISLSLPDAASIDMLQICDYRVIYEFNREKNVLYLLAVGNRREIYR